MSRATIRALVLGVSVLLASLGGAGLAGSHLHGAVAGHPTNVADGGAPTLPPTTG